MQVQKDYRPERFPSCTSRQRTTDLIAYFGIVLVGAGFTLLVLLGLTS